jgi:hypothetical protein
LYEPIKFTAATRLALVATRNSHAALQSESNVRVAPRPILPELERSDPSSYGVSVYRSIGAIGMVIGAILAILTTFFTCRSSGG